jgi:hypothetical protein
VIELKNAFYRLISKLDTAEEKLSKLEDMTTDTSKTEKSKEKYF